MKSPEPFCLYIRVCYNVLACHNLDYICATGTQHGDARGATAAVGGGGARPAVPAQQGAGLERSQQPAGQHLRSRHFR